MTKKKFLFSSGQLQASTMSYIRIRSRILFFRWRFLSLPVVKKLSPQKNTEKANYKSNTKKIPYPIRPSPSGKDIMEEPISEKSCCAFGSSKGVARSVPGTANLGCKNPPSDWRWQNLENPPICFKSPEIHRDLQICLGHIFTKNQASEGICNLVTTRKLDDFSSFPARFLKGFWRFQGEAAV